MENSEKDKILNKISQKYLILKKQLQNHQSKYNINYMDIINADPLSIDIPLFHFYKIVKKLLQCYNDNYYIKNSPLISDDDYDHLYSEFEKFEIFQKLEKNNLKKLEYLEKEEILLNKIDEKSIAINELAKDSPLKKVTHKVPLRSIKNVYSLELLFDFFKNVKKKLNTNQLSFILQPKIDGASVILIYEDGIFKQSLTRGDFSQGEDITFNIQHLNCFPKKLSKKIDLILRGEIYCPLSIFKKINLEAEEKKQKIFANPRNLAAGSLRLLDSKEFIKRDLKIYFYDHFLSSNNYFKDDLSFLDFLKEEKFHVIPESYIKIFKNIEALTLSDLLFFKNVKKDLDVDIDGVVIKLNEYHLRNKLASTQQHINWALAYKFESEYVETTIKDIHFSVSRYGEITPIGILEPTDILGTIVQRVSLSNFTQILKKDIRIGDRVQIEKAGEIIPHLVSVLKEKREKPLNSFKLPQSCPSCFKKLNLPLDKRIGFYLSCANKKCKNPRKIRLEKHKLYNQSFIKNTKKYEDIKKCPHCFKLRVSYVLKIKKLQYASICMNKQCDNPSFELLKYDHLDYLYIQKLIYRWLKRKKLEHYFTKWVYEGNESNYKLLDFTEWLKFKLQDQDNFYADYIKFLKKTNNNIDLILFFNEKKLCLSCFEIMQLDKSWKYDYQTFLICENNLCIQETAFAKILSKNSNNISKLIEYEFQHWEACAKKSENKEKLNKISIHCTNCSTRMELKELIEKNYYRRICIYKETCKEQIIKRLAHFASRKAMNIESLSISTLKILFEEGFVKNYCDLYILNREKVLEKLSGKGFGSKMFEKIQSNIIESKKQHWTRLLYAIGVDDLGEGTIQILSKKYKSFEEIAEQDFKSLKKIRGLGHLGAIKIFRFLKNKSNIELIKQLKSLGLKTSEDKKILDQNTLLDPYFENKSIVVTGKIYDYSRNAIHDLLRKKGAMIQNTVSKNTDYLILGENPGKNKIEKARFLNIKQIDYLKIKEKLNA